MRLEILEDGNLIVHETGRQKNGIEYESNKHLENYSRWKLSVVEDFFREQKQYKEADKIKKYMGKTLKHKNVPQLIPTGTYRINQPLNTLLHTLDRYKENDNLDLNPDFQRHHVWNLKQRIAFVEFILQGGKTNPIYFNCPTWMKGFGGQMVIIDGKQRLTSLIMFLNNEFPVFKNLDDEDVGYYYKELDTIHIGCDIIFIINDLQTKRQELMWYLQMNRGNVAHTEKELNKVEAMLLKLEKVE